MEEQTNTSDNAPEKKYKTGHTATPAAKSRAVTKYIKNHYDRIELRMPKNEKFKEAVAQHAKITGESVNAFILRAIEIAMDFDATEAIEGRGGFSEEQMHQLAREYWNRNGVYPDGTC